MASLTESEFKMIEFQIIEARDMLTNVLPTVDNEANGLSWERPVIIFCVL